MRKRFALLFVIAVFLGVSLPTGLAGAQARSVTVLQRDAEISIQTNGDVQITETWQVAFAGSPAYTQAFRAIPANRIDNIAGWGVSEGNQQFAQNGLGTDRTYDVARNSDGWRITWHFSPASNQTRTFVLRYTLQGALRIYESGDQFWYTFVEADRGYTIQSSRVVVRLPSTFETSQIKASTYTGQLQTPGSRVADSRTAEFAGGPFPAGNNWEIRVQFPHGAVSAGPPGWQQIEDRQPILNLIGLVLAVILLLGGLLGLYLLWYLLGRDRPTGVVAEFYAEPPDNLPPGMAGALVDEKADLQDIVATVVDLARRGYLTMEEIKTEGFLGIGDSSNFAYHRTAKSDSDLRPYERDLLKAVFEGNQDRDLADLRNHFYLQLPSLRTAIYQELVQAGYFPANPNRTRWLYGSLGCATIAFVVACSVVGIPMVLVVAPLGILVFVSAGIVALGLMLISPAMTRKSAKGATTAARFQAFRRYLQHVDRYTNVAEARDQFDRYLPYAVAFGLERSWIGQFERVETPVPIWYQPYGYEPSGGYSSSSSGTGSGESKGGESRSGERGGGERPTLDSAASGAFGGLTVMSAGFFGMLSATASEFTSTPHPSSSGGSDGSNGGDSGSGWSGGDDSGGGGGGGGSSGFD